MFMAGCDDGDGGDDSGTDGTDGTSMTPTSTTNPDPSTSGPPGTTDDSESASASAGETSTGPGGETSDGSTSDGSTSSADTGGSESGSGGEVVFDEEFVWVADFVRGNCVKCHADGNNGAMILPSTEMSNEEVRMALEGITAGSGLLLVEPGDRNASQTYLQITNEFGAQFPVKQTDRFGAWIDAGANYYQ